MNDHKSPTAADDLTMLDVEETCRFFGGQKSPIDPSTLYKGIKTGKGAVRNLVGNRNGVASDELKLSDQAARSIG